MQKAILVKDLDTGSESWEALPNFQLKPGGKADFNREITKLREAVDNAQSIDALKVLLHALLNHIGKA